MDLLDGAKHVAALVDVTAQRRGLSLNDQAVQLLGFRDDRITLRQLYPEDQAASVVPAESGYSGSSSRLGCSASA